MDAILLITLVILGTAALSWPLGRYLHHAMDPLSMAGMTARFDRLFRSFGGSLAREQQDWKRYAFALLGFNVVMFCVSFAIMALQNLGVELLPLVAGLGVAGAGIALAMQGVLGNLAAGLTIILTRPFRVGEFISIVKEEGEVTEISLFSTTLATSVTCWVKGSIAGTLRCSSTEEKRTSMPPPIARRSRTFHATLGLSAKPLSCAFVEMKRPVKTSGLFHSVRRPYGT